MECVFSPQKKPINMEVSDPTRELQPAGPPTATLPTDAAQANIPNDEHMADIMLEQMPEYLDVTEESEYGLSRTGSALL